MHSDGREILEQPLMAFLALQEAQAQQPGMFVHAQVNRMSDELFCELVGRVADKAVGSALLLKQEINA